MRFDRESGVYEALRKELRKFTPLPKPDSAGDAVAALGGGGGGAPTIVVAASDASELSKSKADLICTGSDDQDVIGGAIDQLPLSATVGGMVVLTEGTFNLDDTIALTRANVYIQGRGHDVTTLNFSTVNAVEFTGSAPNFTISDLTFAGNASANFALFQTDTGNIADFAAVRCNFLQCGSGAILLAGTTNEGTSRGIVYHNEFKECGGTNGQVEIGGTTSNGGVVVAMNFFYNGTERPIFGGASVEGTASLNSFVGNTGTTPNVSGLTEVHNHASSSVSETYEADDQHGDQGSFSDPGTATGVGTFRLYFKKAATITNVSAALDTAPTGSTYIVDVHKNGTTIFPTQANRPTIAISGFQDNATLETTAVAAGEFLTVDIDQVGSTITGASLTVTVNWTNP